MISRRWASTISPGDEARRCGGSWHAARDSGFLLIQFSFLFAPGFALERENSGYCLVGKVFGAELLLYPVG
jgi:hypothetical protein